MGQVLHGSARTTAAIRRALPEGKATYYAAVSKYLRERSLFPELPGGANRNYSIGGTRHTYKTIWDMQGSRTRSERCS